jgi:transposase-like protein
MSPVKEDDFENFNEFEELDAIAGRLERAEHVNVWGRKKQTRPDWSPTMRKHRVTLSDEDKAEILRLYPMPEQTADKLAQRFGVSVGTVYKLAKASGVSSYCGKRGKPAATAPPSHLRSPAGPAYPPVAQAPPRVIGEVPTMSVRASLEGPAEPCELNLVLRIRVLVDVQVGN